MFLVSYFVTWIHPGQLFDIYWLPLFHIFFTGRTNGVCCLRKIRSRPRSLRPPPSLRPGVHRSDTMGPREEVSRRRQRTTDRTAEFLLSLPARNRSWMAAQHSQYNIYAVSFGTNKRCSNILMEINVSHNLWKIRPKVELYLPIEQELS